MKSIHLLQAEYWESPRAFESAKLIVGAKCWNMRHLLKRYAIYRNRAYEPQSRIIRQATAGISDVEAKLRSLASRQDLLLAEGRATRNYWQGFAVIAKCPPGWKRVHPHGEDAWNSALNIGYSMLANLIRRVLEEHGLSLQIGMLHFPRQGREPLLYDLEELFRQPFVDAAVLPIFSRNKQKNVRTEWIVSAVTKAFARKMKYGRFWLDFKEIANQEIFKYMRAIRSSKIYYLHRQSWAHWTKK